MHAVPLERLGKNALLLSRLKGVRPRCIVLISGALGPVKRALWLVRPSDAQNSLVSDMDADRNKKTKGVSGSPSRSP